MLEYVKIASEVGAVGVLALIVYLFCTGRIMSEQSVEKLMQGQANHIADLKDVMEKKFNRMIKILEDIRDDGRTNQKK